MTARRVDIRLVALLAVSYALRLALVAQGGEGFWPDEHRYAGAQIVVHALRGAQWRTAVGGLFGNAIHPLFIWFGLPAAAFEEWAGPHPAGAAAYFALYSVLALFLIWSVARRAGAGRNEALWAAGLAAGANSLFYYARHFFPYDPALCAVLGACWLGLGPWSWRNACAVGAAAGVGFLTYNGYWSLSGTVLVLYAFWGEGGARKAWARGLGAGVGLLAALAVFLGLAATQGYNLVGAAREFSATITQGDFHTGYRQIPAYLWFAERGSLLVWAGALVYAGWSARRERWSLRLRWAIGGLALFGGGLVFFSDVVPKFVVYGRLVRGLVPFICLGAAEGIARFLRGRRAPGAWTAAMGALVLGCAALNFVGPLRQVFPDQFGGKAAAAIARDPAYHAYRLANVHDLWALPPDSAAPGAAVPFRRSHPLQFRPYQYEGYSAAQRAALNRQDVAMQLVATGGGFALGRYPGPVRFVLRFPAAAIGETEPLITTGRTGRGDLLFVRYDDGGHVRFGVDHWGVKATFSSPVALDYARSHQLVVQAGFLNGAPAAPPAGLQLWLDGKIVFAMTDAFYPVPATQIRFGVNFIGGSTVGPTFTGAFLEFGPASAGSFPPLRPGPPD